MTAAIGFHVIESTLFAVLVAVFVFVFRKRGPSFRYALWLTAVVKFAVPVALFSMLGIHFRSVLPSEFLLLQTLCAFRFGLMESYRRLLFRRYINTQSFWSQLALSGLVAPFSRSDYGSDAAWRSVNLGIFPPNRSRPY